MEPWDILEDAADHLDEHGWLQHRVEDLSGRVCAIGALNRAVRLRRWGEELDDTTRTKVEDRDFALAYLEEVIGEEDVAAWNDVKGRKKQHVLDALREAAKYARTDAGE